MKLYNAHSLGCIDYGNNNFFEIMRSGNTVAMFSHEDDTLGKINPDGTYDVTDGITVDAFIEEVKDREDFSGIMKELCETLIKR